jgi:hypothetical protein
MLTPLLVIWNLLCVRRRNLRLDETGSVVETVIITAIFAALALAIGTIIVTKVTAKANSVNLN